MLVGFCYRSRRIESESEEQVGSTNHGHAMLRGAVAGSGNKSSHGLAGVVAQNGKSEVELGIDLRAKVFDDHSALNGDGVICFLVSLTPYTPRFGGD